MSYKLDVETFISEMESHPEIWDMGCEGYRDKTSKQQAWADLARAFISDYDDMAEVEKFEVLQKLSSKWRHIRDSYVRHLRNLKRDPKSTYAYAKQLSFLARIYKRKKARLGHDSDDEEKEERLPRRKPKVECEVQQSSWHSDGEDTPLESVRKRAKAENFIEYVETPLMDKSGFEDEDKSFFDSLLPAVRDFDTDQKLEFRSEVIRLIKNIRNSTVKTDPVSQY